MSTATPLFRLVKPFFYTLLVMLAACSGSNSGKSLQDAGSSLSSAVRPPDTTLQVKWKNSERAVYIMPANTFFSKGTILLLHGWNLDPNGWCEQTTLCRKLRDEGFNVVVPDMGKSMYASAVYPETMQTMADQPQKSWICDTVIPMLRDSLELFQENTFNFLIGLSTGARGAFTIGLEMPQYFSGAVVLSGDYDQTQMPDDHLMTFYYGNYDMFPERWEGEDNLFLQAEKWILPIYIGHAADDPVVPAEQSRSLNSELLSLGKVKPLSHFPERYGHDYRYWESETENIMQFIKDICSRAVAVQ